MRAGSASGASRCVALAVLERRLEVRELRVGQADRTALLSPASHRTFDLA
jgi:hypothetical protein